MIKRKKKEMTPSQKHIQHILCQLEQQESAFNRAEQETTEMVRNDKNNKQRMEID
jgi:hypothetical protein